MKLIVGLGNPGRAYDKTRHNIGFRVVKAFAAKYGADFHRAVHIDGKLAETDKTGEKLLFLLPQTYMNSSGVAVKKCIREFQLNLDDFLVVMDDADIHFGKIRLRDKGSAGGHHGLESISHHLQTDDYSRLKIGIGNPNPGDLAPHVLGKFTLEEETELPRIIDESIQAIEKWLLKQNDSKSGDI